MKTNLKLNLSLIVEGNSRKNDLTTNEIDIIGDKTESKSCISQPDIINFKELKENVELPG